MNKKTVRNVILLVSTTVATGMALVSSVFAWFRPLQRIKLDDAKGKTDNTAYFAGGTGTEDDPYLITNPIHLYNLAWLQYLGIFNEDAPIEKYYFELKNELDMTGYTLPPIGTEKYPFFSSFEGNGYSVSNLTVSNSSGTEPYEIFKTPVGVTTINDCDIVGFFGVVGDYKSHTASSIVPEVKNFYLDNVTINSNNNKTLAGIGVGYVNGEVSKVGVSNSEIHFNNSAITALDTSITNNLSDYTLVGYCKPEYRNSTSITDTKVNTPLFETKTFNYEGPEGTTTGSGGSIPMSDIYKRVYAIGNTYAQTTSTNAASNNYYLYQKDIYTIKDTGEVITTDYATNRAKVYNSNIYNTANGQSYHEEWGSYVFNYYNNSNNGWAYSTTDTTENFMYLSGGLRTLKYDRTYPQTAGYKISLNGTYLNVNNSYTGFTQTTNVNNATIWFPTNGLNNGSTFYVTKDAVDYYISINNSGTLVLTSGDNNNAVNKNNSTLRRNSGQYQRQYYYVTYKNGNWTSTTTSTDLNFTSARGPKETNQLVKNSVDYDTKNVTYIPLSTVDSVSKFAPIPKNTGYIISGSDDKATSQTWPVRSGDIRISKYKTSSLNGYSNGNFSTIYTINNSGRQTITNSTSYEKLSKTKTALANTIQKDGMIYGLHFMNAQISDENIVTADYALINEIEYDDYQLPANCIDFNLGESGWVNMMCGTYFSGNNSFVSLHHIERSGTTITNIKEIEEIYWDKDTTHEVVYKYATQSGVEYSIAHTLRKGKPTETIIDGSTKTSLPNSGAYKSVFKTAWMKNSSGIDVSGGNAYYFEFPMSVGEFALGSVDGKTGAYLMYLDIATNAQKISETAIYEKWTYETRTYVTPFGIALVSSTEDEINNYEGIIAFAIKSYVDKVGVSYIQSGTEDKVTYTCNNMNNVECVYKTMSAILVDKNNQEITQISYDQLKTESHTRTSYYDYNETTEKTVVTTILDGVITVKKYDKDGKEVAFEDKEKEFYQNLDKHEAGSALNTIFIEFSYQCITSTKVEVTCTIDLDTALADGSEVDVISVLKGYKFTFTCEYENNEIPELTAKIIHVDGDYILQIVDSDGNIIATNAVQQS